MAVAEVQSVRPPLKWAGGKRWQVPYLRPLWAAHDRRRLVEPFCGGLAVALGLAPARALLNDRNPHLVNFYRWLQRGLVVDTEMANDERLFYRQRARFNQLVAGDESDSAEAAGLFYYLNRTGYNGLCRFNSRGEFNVPFGRYAAIEYRRDFREYRGMLEPWQFTVGDLDAVSFEPDDFVYADPPYDVPFTQYSRGGFGWIDQEHTAVVLSTHPGPVILVNQATERIERLYRDLRYSVSFLDAPRRISSNGDRRPAREIVATKNLG